jgi:hypothetical protein
MISIQDTIRFLALFASFSDHEEAAWSLYLISLNKREALSKDLTS